MEMMEIRIHTKMRSYDNIKYFKYKIQKLVQKQRIGDIKSFKTEANEDNIVLHYCVDIALMVTSQSELNQFIQKISQLELPLGSTICYGDQKVEIGKLEEVVLTSKDLLEDISLNTIRDLLSQDLRYVGVYRAESAIYYYLYGNNIKDKLAWIHTN